MAFYLIDKPSKFTSHDVVTIVKNKTNSKKAGHSGTLDPFATGLLIVATENDTKFLELFLDSKKTYIGEIMFGISTDTHDIDGTTTDTLDSFEITENDLTKLIQKKYIGKIKQIPHKFSSVKVNGKKSYDLARAGEEVILKPVERHIYDFEISKTENKNVFTFKVEASSGTYVRSLVRDISLDVKIPAHLISLRRTKIGILDIKDSNKSSDETMTSLDNEKIVPIKRYLVDVNTMKTLLEGKAINFENSQNDLLFTDNSTMVWAKKTNSQTFKIYKRIF